MRSGHSIRSMPPTANAIFASTVVRNNGATLASYTAELDNVVSNLDNMWSLATPSYSDQVLPFNVTLTGANEYGAMTCGKILGIEILNEVGLFILPDHKSLAHPRGAAACPRHTPCTPAQVYRAKPVYAG